MKIRTILFSIICLIISSYAYSQEKPKNINLMIGDGMGPAQVNTLRYLKAEGESAIWKFPYRGTSMTYCLSDSITDSAAGGSALATGKKTTKGYLSINTDSTANETLLEWANQRNMATGIVVTCGLTHATPASFY